MTIGRRVQINQTILDQADFFQVDGFTRVAGLTVLDLTSQVFYNNQIVPWPLADGSSVSDSQIAAGSLYFHEIVGTSGNYSVRFRPNAAGYWRVLLGYSAGTQTIAQDYDVTEPSQTGGGLRTSFVDC